MTREEFLRLSADQKRTYLAERKGRTSDHASRLPTLVPDPAGRHDPFPLTDMQQAFVAGRRLSRSAEVGCHIYLELLFEDLDIDRLEHAFNRVLQKHGMLTTIVSRGTQQRMVEVPHYTIVRYPAGTDESASLDQQLADVRAKLSHRVYPLGEWPLFCVAVSALYDGRAVLHLSVDELIADATSLGLVLEQWQTLYENPEREVGKQSVEFRDVVRAERAFESSQAFRKDLQYWLDKLVDMPSGPTFARTGNAPDSGHRERVQHHLDGKELSSLRGVAKEHGVTLNTLLLTAYAEALAKGTDGRPFALIQTFFNRLPLNYDVSEVVGPFTSSSVFVPAPSNLPLAERLAANQVQSFRDLEHSRVGAVRVLRTLKQRKTLARGVTLPVVFTSTVGSLGAAAGNWFSRRIYSITQTPQVFLDHQAHEERGGMTLHWDFAPDWLPRPQAEQMFHAYVARLTSLARGEVCPTRQLDLVRPVEWCRAPTSDGPFSLSPLQRAYVLSRKSTQPDARNCLVYQEIDFAVLDLARLSRAFDALIAQHEMLRVVIDEDGRHRPYHGSLDLQIQVHEASEGPAYEHASARNRDELFGTVFELGTWPMLGCRVVCTPDRKKARLHLAIDGMVADGKSIELLYRQLLLLYADPSASLTKPSIGFRDYIASIERFAGSPEAERARAYWNDKLTGIAPPPSLPLAAAHASAERVRFDAAIPGWGRIVERAEQCGVDPSIVALTAYMEALASVARDPAFTVVIANWDRLLAHPEVDDLVGDFCSLAWVTRDAGKQAFAERVRRNHASVHGDWSHSGISGTEVLRRLSARRRAPAGFPIVFTKPLREDVSKLPEGVSFGHGQSRTPQVLLDHLSLERGDALHVHWDLASHGLDPAALEGAFRVYVAQLNDIAKEPERFIAATVLPTKTHRERVGSAASMGSEDRLGTLHQWFERVAERRPDAIAVQCEGQSLTYRELNSRANRLAAYLGRRGVREEQLVGLWVDRTLETVVGILGILKAGGAYLPLDAKYPRERTQLILDDAAVSMLLTTSQIELGGAGQGREVLRLDTEWEAQIAGESDANPTPRARPENTAYVIYTSGSTGRPKGVEIEHRNVTRLFTETEVFYGFGERDVWTMTHSHSFDVSVFEIFGSLLHGGRLIIVPYAVSRSFDALHALLVREGVTVLSQTPTAFRYLLDADGRSPEFARLALRYVIMAGERLDFAMLRPWFERHGDTTALINMYGITETTVHSTFRRVRREDVDGPSLIGVPIPDLKLHLLDAGLKPVAQGDIGEIYVEGPGVARGYFRNPELTRERFLASPFAPGARLYKSGDLARLRPDGDMEYIGRADLQVQLRGFRVELGEVEAGLLRLPSVRAAAVVVDDSDPRSPTLVAFVVKKEGVPGDATELRHGLRKTLPDYMVPSRIEWLATLPLTAVGKLDRKALGAMARTKQTPSNAQAQAPTLQPVKRVTDRADEVARLVARELGVPHVSIDADIFDLGATSLTVTDIAARVKSELGLDLPVESWLEHPTVGEVCACADAGQPSVSAMPEVPMPIAAKQRDPAATSVAVETLRTLLCSELGLSDLGDDADIFDLGASSLTVANVSQSLREKTGCELGVEVLLERTTLRELRAYLAEAGPVAVACESATAASQPEVAPGEVTLDVLTRQLAVLRPRMVDGRMRHQYASAGGKYAVQVYVEVQRVASLEPGIYYYDPESHELSLLERDASSIRQLHHPRDRARHTAAPYCLYLVAQLDALRPTYGRFSETFGYLDAGYIEQLVRRRGRDLGVGYHSALGADFVRARSVFRLQDGHRFLCCLFAERADARSMEPKATGSFEPHLARSEQHLTLAELHRMYREMTYSHEQNQGPASFDKSPLNRRLDRGLMRVTLPDVADTDAAYRRRICHRSYDPGAVELERLAAWFATLADKASPTFASPAAVYGVELYLHVKANRVAGLRPGVHRVNTQTGEISFLVELEERTLKRCHSPFNRAHFEASAFSLFLAANVGALERQHGPQALEWLLREAGNMGQLLMETQASNDLGLVPIGGLNSAPINKALGWTDDYVVLHGMLGGVVRREQAHAGAQSTHVAATSAPSLTAPNPTAGYYEPIAIVGLSGRYPDASNLSQFWSLLSEGRSGIRKASEARPFLSREGGAERWGGFLSHIDGFDAPFFRVAPAEADTMEPEVRLCLEQVWAALEDAGMSPQSLRAQAATVGAFIGAMYSHYHLLPKDPELREQMSLQSYSGIVNRVSHFYDFRGPSVAVDAACASSLIAVHMATESLQRGDCDVALAGGVNLSLYAGKYAGLAALGLLGSLPERGAYSDSDGFTPGEGVGFAVLKTLARAEADGDRIYAVVRGSATNHSGRTAVFNMPSAQAQATLIKRALERAKVRPEEVSYVESAATGSPLADPVELSALRKVFDAGREAPRKLALGSLKGHIGHLEAASGIAQLTKVVLQLQHAQLAPTLYTEPQNPAVRFEGSALSLQRELAPWSRASSPRVSCLGSFGAGGSNAYLVVSEYATDVERQACDATPTVLTLSARDADALERQAQQLCAFLESRPCPLEDVAYTLARRESMRERLALVVADVPDAVTKLRARLAKQVVRGVYEGRVEASGLGACLRQDDDAERMVSAWAKASKLDSLAAGWAHGLDVDFRLVPSFARGRLTWLPGYPFATTSHWVSMVEEAAESEAAPEEPQTETLGPPVAPMAHEALSELTALVARVLRVPETKVDPDLPLDAHGLSSLLAMRLIRAVEGRFGVHLELRQVVRASVRQLCTMLGAESTARGDKSTNGAFPHSAPGGLLRSPGVGEISPAGAATNLTN